MARMFDELSLMDQFRNDYSELISETVVINANTVREYVHSMESSMVKWDRKKHFPNSMPVYPSTFIEWKEPKKISYLTGVDRIGVLLVALDPMDILSESNISNLTTIPKYFITAVPFYFFMETQMLYECMRLNFLVDDYGKWPESRDGDIYYSAQYPPGVDTPLTAEAIERASAMLRVALTTLSFIHCKKQTKLIEHIPPDKVQKKRERNNRPPLTKYYTLDIEPLKEILRTEGRIHEVGLQKALHICRGHFKDYSQGAGLFGKYKGLYWWDNHIRGNEEVGKIVKDYAVKLPNEVLQ